jgi:hypothetical protein
VARDDWRIRIELAEEPLAERLLSRLHLDLGSEARELAKELEARRLAVSRDENDIYVYAASGAEAEQARGVIEAVIRDDDDLEVKDIRIEHWLAEEERWDDEPPQPDVEEEALSRGYAPWEVRVECESVEAARRLADELEAEGYGVVHTFRFVVAGTETREEAKQLARRVHGEVEPGGELVWEVAPQNPFAIFGGLGT